MVSMWKVHRDTAAARDALNAQRASGTHNPATQCGCGAWRTPGQVHSPPDKPTATCRS